MRFLLWQWLGNGGHVYNGVFTIKTQPNLLPTYEIELVMVFK